MSRHFIIDCFFYDASRYLPLIISLKIHVYRAKKFHRVTHSPNSITNKFTSIKKIHDFFFEWEHPKLYSSITKNAHIFRQPIINILF